MKSLKLKFAFISLLAAMTLTVFMTSCEQETIIPETTDIPGISADFKAYVENLDPEVFTSSEPVPERTPENTVNADISDRNCFEFNKWHYSPALGWCFIVGEGQYYGLDVTVFSEKYGVYGIVFKMGLCNPQTSIYTNNLCGKSGWFWDNDETDGWIQHHSNNGPHTTIYCPGSTASLGQDYSALRALYLCTNGDNWTNNTGWPTRAQFAANPTMPAGTDLNTWKGVVTNADGRVTCLDMGDPGNSNCTFGGLATFGNNLVGYIPLQIGYLTRLTNLNLTGNQLGGSIPPTIGNLVQLRSLYLGANNLSGNIPLEIGNLINLKNLSIFTNNLSGGIPSEIGNLTNLETISLADNQLSGTIPPEIGDLSSLRFLTLQTNQLSGCYDSNLNSLCTPSTSVFLDRNNFNVPWESFCANGAGTCP